MTFKCSRCGKCCLMDECKGLWINGTLTWKQKQELLEERKKYSDAVSGCEMMYFKDGLSHCLVREMFEGTRPHECPDYPKLGEKCLNDIERT